MAEKRLAATVKRAGQLFHALVSQIRPAEFIQTAAIKATSDQGEPPEISKMG